MIKDESWQSERWMLIKCRTRRYLDCSRLIANFMNSDFPPYDVLHFKTISFHLALEAMPTQERHRTSPFDRVVGIPLHDKTGELVGSLHPDNFDLLCSQGSSVELLVITKCLEPTVGSALSALENQGPLPWRLLWVMHIVWKQGIAERHGVGQVLASALERSVGPRPQVKRILLG